MPASTARSQPPAAQRGRRPARAPGSGSHSPLLRRRLPDSRRAGRHAAAGARGRRDRPVDGQRGAPDRGRPGPRTGRRAAGRARLGPRAGRPRPGPADDAEPWDRCAAHAERELAETLRPLRKAQPDLRLRPLVVCDDAAPLLTMLSTGAELLVLGRSARGAAARTLAGAPATDVAAVARCPVLVVPDQPGCSPGRCGATGRAGSREGHAAPDGPCVRPMRRPVTRPSGTGAPVRQRSAAEAAERLVCRLDGVVDVMSRLTWRVDDGGLTRRR
jgi:hypothetical protein